MLDSYQLNQSPPRSTGNHPMKKLLALLLLLSAPAFASSTSENVTPGYLVSGGQFLPYTSANPLPVTASAANITGTLPVANGGTGLVPGLSFNSTSAATANTSAIQTALTAQGHVYLDCPYNSVLWINGPLTISSNTHLEVKQSCHLEQSANNQNNMLVNAAYLSAWTTEYINGGTIATGPLAVIWSGSTPAWAQSTAYSKGNYVVANGNIYWENASSCTSLSSGAGPKGSAGSSTGPTGTTGASISDGTCSWYYVTTVAVKSTTLSAVVYWPANTLPLYGYIAITPQPDNDTTRQWTGSQAAHARGGPSDTAYFGTFKVAALNDSNWATVILERVPGANFSGIPVQVKQADQGITITGGGTWDYNAAQNAVVGSETDPSIQRNSIAVLSSVALLTIDGFVGQNANKYVLNLNGTKEGFIRNISSPNTTNSDLVKVYGSFDTTVQDLHCFNSDDCFSFQTGEGASFIGEIITSQDVLNSTARNISGDGGLNVKVDPTDANCIIDNVVIDGVQSLNNLVGGSSINNAAVFTIQGTASGSGTIGRLYVSNINNRSTTSSSPTVYTYNAFSATEIVFDGVSGNYNSVSGAHLFDFSSGMTANYVAIKNPRFVAGSNGILANMSGTINLLDIQGGSFSAASAGTGNVVWMNSGSSISQTNVRGMNIVNANYIVYNQNSSGGTTVNFTDNVTSGTSQAGYGASGGTSTLLFSGNNFSGMTLGAARFNATATVIMRSAGNNVMTGSSIWWAFPVGTDTSSSYGWDIQCDVTKMTRTTGEYCYNTNTSPGSGTLTTAGLVADQGTSSNSWFLMSNPSGQVY